MIVLLRMKIIGEEESCYKIQIEQREGTKSTVITFNPYEKTLFMDESDTLGKFIKDNEYQFRKLLHNKRLDTYKIGFALEFSIIDKKDIEKFSNKNNIVVTDKGEVYVITNSEENILHIYTDGSYDEKSKAGAYGYALEIKGIIIDETYKKSVSRSSSHLELLAVLAAIEKVQDKKIRIYTDSQYVRKGITEWIYHWRENNFTTANGIKAKNVDDWIKLDRLIRDKYIEWVWIKSHRSNEIHNRVDKNVRNIAKGI